VATLESKQDIEKIRKFNRFYANILGKIDQEIYNQPFSLSEARVITEIHMRNGCTATEVRETLGIDRGYMSRMIQRFEEEKIITKKQSSDDKRQFLLFLTENGKEIYAHLVEEASRGVGKMIRQISKPYLSKLITSMETIESIFSTEHDRQPEVTIQSFQPGDVGYIAHLHGRYYQETYKFGPMFEYYVMKGLTEFMVSNDGGDLWIAKVNDKIVGSIAITKFDDSTAQLRWFILDEKYHGLGIGKKLMDTAMQFCNTQGYQHIFLWTVSILEAARHLYQKYNFKITEEKPNDEWTESTVIEERWDLVLK
jgi:DNA-binding MarR family transcriptional regulator/ribosomal protein S18 acetylase RimI-like enzyme